MPKQVVINEIAAPVDKVWNLIVDPKEFAFWAPNVRDLELEPKDNFGVDTLRHFRLETSGKIETLDTKITHFSDQEYFSESPVGGSLKLHEKVEHLRMTYRVEPTDDRKCCLTFTIDWEMKGLLNKMLEKIYIGTFVATLRLWFERLATYAETGRPV
jgi:hypothetical protein